MLEDRGWETLEVRRQKLHLTLFYKVVNDLIDIPAEQYLTPAPSKLRSNHKFKYMVMMVMVIISNASYPSEVAHGACRVVLCIVTHLCTVRHLMISL